MLSWLAVGVPGWPRVRPGFDAMPLIVLAAVFAVAILALRIPITGRAMAWTAGIGVALGITAAWLGPVPVLAFAVLVVALAVASKRNPRVR